MGREFELKYSASEELLRAVEERFGGFHTIAMETTYFDTPEGALSARRITLRQRLENGLRISTVKTPLEASGRGEWELAWDDAATMVEALCKLGAPEEIKELTKGGLTPICGARFTRKARLVELGSCTVEMALDRGVLTGGGREMPLCELEVELKSGDEDACVAFAAALAREFGLQQENKSKFRRALALAKGE